VDAAEQCGIARRGDFNSGEQDGAGFLRFTIRNGLRSSSYDAFVAPIRRRRNLTVVTGAQVERVTIENRRATGVLCRRKGSGAS
jgi:choline dehydrogenase